MGILSLVIIVFLWLILHRKVLTWENLVKRGMLGPSWCFLCEKEHKESPNHLLNTCRCMEAIWDWLTIIYRQTHRNNKRTQETIKHWRLQYTKNEEVNMTWNLIL